MRHSYVDHVMPILRRQSGTAVLFLVICTVFYVLRTPDLGSFAPPSSAPQTEEDLTLDGVLKSAATVDKTVILTTLNAAWARPGSVLDIFLESFGIGVHTRRLLDHLVIIALDQEAYERCKSVHVHCFALKTEGVDFSGQKNYMSDGYLKMMWRRIDFLRIVLQKGYGFVFTDTDVLWFRDPFPNFYRDGDFQISCDYFNGNLSDTRNAPNGGFKYVRSSSQTIEFYKFWYSARLKYPHKHDQDVLNFIKSDISHGLKIKFLDTTYFGGLCEPSKDISKVCTMHTNCCIGLSRKVHDLGTMLEDWKLFKALPPDAKHSQSKIWRVPQNCSLLPIR